MNEPYWQYIHAMIASARKYFLKGHDVDFFLWTDMPTGTQIDAKIIPTEPHAWPTPTLMRYHLFLKQEKELSDYDFIYYVDADMKFVSPVRDEVFGDLVGAQHPMYAIKKEYIPPYEPNEKSASFIPRPGRVVVDGDKKRYEPLYFAGGFQGGRADKFISAMKEMRDMIDKDFIENNYVPIWNDESTWNAYLFKNKPDVVLSPSYVYPDTLNTAYYRRIWGRNYVPKLVTITKNFGQTKQGGDYIKQAIQNI